MQPMVVLTKQQCKDRFSERLNEAVEKVLGAGRDQRPHTALIRKHLDKVVTYEAMRKWLSGEAIPDMTHVSMICTHLKVRPTWLMTGIGPMLIADEKVDAPKAARDNVVKMSRPVAFPDDEALSKLYEQLSEKQKGAIEERIRSEAEKTAAEADKANLRRKKKRR